MPPLSDEEQQVARHYDQAVFDFERERLQRHHPVEYGITSRCLRRWLPDQARVAEVGVGAGLYAEQLARRGCALTLVDIAPNLLAMTETRLRSLGLEGQIEQRLVASATHLAGLDAGGYDAVLLLGPLYHLRALELRQQAVRAAARVLKPGGVLFAAAINRLAFLRDMFRDAPETVVANKQVFAAFLRDGNLDPISAPPMGYAHLTTPLEFRALFKQDFTELTLLGAESFTAPFQHQLADLAADQAEAWLDLVEQTATSPEGMACADHFLYIGQRVDRLGP